MNELENNFQQCWDEFTKIVLAKTLHSECNDPVRIVMNSGLFKLTKDQFVTLMILSVVHTAIATNCGAEAAISAALTTERVDILKQIIGLIQT